MTSLRIFIASLLLFLIVALCGVQSLKLEFASSGDRTNESTDELLKSIKFGEIIYFNDSKPVFMVIESMFMNCSLAERPILSFRAGSQFQPKQLGMLYFMSSDLQRCKVGGKVTVEVLPDILPPTPT